MEMKTNVFTIVAEDGAGGQYMQGLVCYWVLRGNTPSLGKLEKWKVTLSQFWLGFIQESKIYAMYFKMEEVSWWGLESYIMIRVWRAKLRPLWRNSKFGDCRKTPPIVLAVCSPENHRQESTLAVFSLPMPVCPAAVGGQYSSFFSAFQILCQFLSVVEFSKEICEL